MLLGNRLLIIITLEVTFLLTRAHLLGLLSKLFELPWLVVKRWLPLLVVKR